MLMMKIDQIYNLACPASPPAYQGNYSIKTTKTCVFGAINMLELAKKHNATICKRLLPRFMASLWSIRKLKAIEAM